MDMDKGKAFGNRKLKDLRNGHLKDIMRERIQVPGKMLHNILKLGKGNNATDNAAHTREMKETAQRGNKVIQETEAQETSDHRKK